MFNEEDLTEEENKDLNKKMLNIYLDPVFKDRLINKNIFKDNSEVNFSDILELKEETKINNKYQNIQEKINKKQINNNKNSNLNKKTKRD